MSNAGVVKVYQVPTDYEKNGVPIGKLLNQSHYYVANDDYKKASNSFEVSRYVWSSGKVICDTDEIKLQKRNPKEIRGV